MDCITEAAEFDTMASHLRTIAEELLNEFFGERCPDYDDTCIVCQRWRALEVLTENPYGQAPWVAKGTHKHLSQLKKEPSA